MIIYSQEKKIELSLKEKILSRDVYADDIGCIVRYGKKILDPRVTIVIVAYNEGKDLIRNLQCWQEQSEDNFEIILVDNGLDEATIREIQKFDVLCIRSKLNLGCCGGRNVGALYANADILIFGDADGYNPGDYVEKAVGIMSDTAIVAVRGKVLPIAKENKKQFMPFHYDLGDERTASIIDTEGNSVWRTGDYIRAGGFEDSLAGGEGLVLQYRMVEFYGYDKESFIYDPALILHHDFFQDENKLDYKIQQNYILQFQSNIRYPFLRRLVSHYANAKKAGGMPQNSSPETSDSDYQKKTSHRIAVARQELSKEYFAIQERRKAERYLTARKQRGTEPYNFSIIIVSYNLGPLISRAIDSVFAQSLEKIEVIVVDNASTDDETQKVLEEIEDLVHVVRLERNRGVAFARNEGVSFAKAQYILCLDAHAKIEPTYLEKAKNIFDADSDVGMVSCWSKTYGGVSNLSKQEDYVDLETALASDPLHTSICFRKCFHDKAGGYDVELCEHEDWDHWIRIIKQGATVRVIPETLVTSFVSTESEELISVKNSKESVTRIVNNHRVLFEKNVETVVAHKHYATAMHKTNCKQLTKELQKRTEKIKKLQDQLDTMHNSTFWRLTSPLRFAVTQLKRLF